MIEIKTFAKPKKTGGSSGSSSSTKYISGVISEAEHAARADKAKRAEVADQANYAGTAASAQNAAYASEAGNIREDAEILQQFLSLEATKDPQVVKGQVKFEQLLQLLQGFSLGNLYGFDGSGNGIINRIASDGFNSASQQGFGINPDDNGRYSLSITDLIVWGKAVFNELEIRKLSYAGGNVYLSGAGSKLVKVVPVVYNRETGECTASTDEECNGWKCYILADDGTTATQNWWMVNDQARCQTFNIKPGAYDNASNKEYWRCVDAVSSESEFIVNDEGDSLYGDKKFDWIILSKTNCLPGSDIPAEGDAIVLDGHQIQPGDEGSISRTNILMLETTGADTPRIVGYRGITDFTHEDKDVFVISPSNVTISSSVFKFKTVSGQTITIINDRGAYDPAVGYYYYDRVIYDNAYWTLIYNGDEQPVKGITPTEEAVNGIVYWRKDLSGGIKGDDAVSYSIQFSIVNDTVNGVTSLRLYVTFTKSVGSNITSGTIGKIGFNGRAKVYLDGEENGVMSSLLIQDYPYIDIGNKGLADMINGKKNLSVELIDANGKVVASNIFFFAEKGDDAVSYTLEASPGYIRLNSDGSIDYTNGYIDKGDEYGSDKYLVVRGYKVAKGVRDNRFSTEANSITLRLTINDGSAYSEYTPSDGDSVSIDFEPKYEDSYYSMLEEISHSGLNSVRVDMCEGSEYNPNKILATCDIPIIQEGKDGQSGEGVVMAYKNATSRPEPPVTEKLSLLTNGWSRTPQKGGSYEKVSNVSYGNYTVGATESGYSTSEWSEVSDGGYTWKKSPAGLSTNSGWALMKVSFTANVDNADVKVVIKAYSETGCDFIQVHDIDREVTGSTSLRKNGVVYTSGNGVEDTYNFTSVGAGQHFFYVSYCKDVSLNRNGDYGLFRLDLSENLVSLPSTVWTSQAVLKEGKAVLPWSTPVQLTGDDAYRVEVSPATLVFDTNENGVVDGSALSGKYATVTVYKGSQKISADNLSLPSNYATKKYTNVEGKISNVNGEARITIDRIEQETISGDEKVSKSSGQISFPIDVLGEQSTLMWVTVNVQVNVSKFTGTVAFDNKRYKLQFDELSNGGGAATKNELNQATSNFEQTAREISLSVSEKSIARRNLLIGSAFLRKDNNCMITSDARIEMNTGYQGTNCIRCIDDTTDGKTRYPGAFWDDSQGGKSVRITKGKKYVISCWYYSNDANGHLCLETLYIDKQTNERLGAPKYLSAGSFVPKPNQWQLFTTVIDTTDALSDYIAFNFYEYCGVKSGLIETYICRPMVEEGDTYGGWTLSQNDYDIIGANLIDNSRTLDTGGNIIEAKGQKALVGDAYELTYRGSDDYNSFYRIDATSFKLDTDYTISFEVRGDAKYMGVYALYQITNTQFTYYAEPKNGSMFEVKDDGKTIRYVALIEVKELSKQQKVWCHFRFKDRLPEQICFQFPSNADQIGVTSWSVTITKPKIEVGAVVTEYTERKSDLVDKASLKAAGIEITSDQITLYGNQIHVKKNKTDANDTVLIDNKTGQVSAGLINADKVVAEGIKTQVLEAQHLNVTGNSRLGIFQIKTSSDDDKRDNYTVDGDMITYSGSYKFPDGKTDIVSYDHFTYLTYKPLFIRQGSADRGKYMRLGDCYTEWDDCGFGFDNSYLFNGASARYVCGGVESECKKYVLPTNLTYSTNFFPVSYIYSTKSSKNDPAFAINVQSSGTAGERTAIQTNGAIRGVLAPNSMSISQNDTIPSGIGVVICTNGSEMTLTLPANPVEGQTLIIIQGSTSKVYIVPSKGDTIYWGGQTRYDTGNRFYSGTIGQFTILVFIRGAWQLQFMNNRP